MILEYRKHTKFKIAVIALVVIVAAIISQPTLAYYVLQGRSISIITTGDVDISIIEKMNGETSTGSLTIVPGSVIDKELYVQNVGGHPCWLRVKLTKGTDVNGKDVIHLRNIDGNNWFYNESDQYYYYRKILPSGATSAYLYKGITIEADETATFESHGGTSVSMKIHAEAIQSENNRAVDKIQSETDVIKVWPREAAILPKE